MIPHFCLQNQMTLIGLQSDWLLMRESENFFEVGQIKIIKSQQLYSISIYVFLSYYNLLWLQYGKYGNTPITFLHDEVLHA